MCIWVVFICAKSPVSCCKVGIGPSIRILIFRQYLSIQRPIFSIDRTVIINIHSTEHSLNGLNGIFLLNKLALKFPPILNILFWNIIQDNFLFYRVDDLFILLDGLIIFSQIAKIASLFEIVLNLFDFRLHQRFILRFSLLSVIDSDYIYPRADILQEINFPSFH